MAQEINLGGTIYISSKHAAAITGYTQDYIGQLARGGSIQAQRVSGVWYVLEDSLRAYKEKADLFVPTPPPPIQNQAEVSVSFDGKDYISANRASKLTSYNQDYVGQLARSGLILSRQIGNRWYVERESILAHKAEKDALLASVQANAVGLAKNDVKEEKTNENRLESDQPHFTYIHEDNGLFPNKVGDTSYESIQEIVEIDTIANDVDQKNNIYGDQKEEANHIPIRVLEEEIEDADTVHFKGISKETNRSKIFLIAFLGLTTVFAVGFYITASIGNIQLPSTLKKAKTAQNASVSSSVVDKGNIQVTTSFLQNLFSNEIIYKRSKDF